MDSETDKERGARLAKEIAKILDEIDQTGAIPSRLSENRGAFIRELYEAWHHNGGLVGGRYRNSVRHMRKEWLTGKSLVRALHAKLVGRVKMTRQDADRLIQLILSKWEYAGVSQTDPSVAEDGYRSFPGQDLKKLRRLLLNATFPANSEENELGILLPHQAREAFDYGDKEVASRLLGSDGFIIVSRHRTVIGPTQPAAMWGMWNQLNDIYLKDKNGGKSTRNIIWVLDAGRSIVEDDLSFYLYYNVGFLALLFRMFARFSTSSDMPLSDESPLVKRLWIGDRDERKKRWAWLNQAGTVIIQNLEREEFIDFYSKQELELEDVRLKDDEVTAEHILPSIMPQKWAKSLKRYYGGRQQHTIDDVTFTIFYKNGGWKDNKDELIYYAHEQEKGIPNIEEDVKWKTNSIKLDSPGASYDQAYRMLYFASKFRLLPKHEEKVQLDDLSVSFAYLRKLGFQVLKLEEFVSVF